MRIQIIFISLVLLLCSCEEEAKRYGNSNSIDLSKINEIDSDDNNRSESSTKNDSYCDLNSAALFDFLVENTFTLNGNGRISFNKTFDYGKDRWVEGKVRISGGRATLSGDYKIVSGSRIYIDNLMANSGTFEASRNNGSSGYFEINCSGDLEGVLSDGNNRKDVVFKKR